MAEKTLKIRRNKDGTMTISSGPYSESFSLHDKNSWQKFEAARWAILALGFAFTPQIERLVKKELNL